MNSITRVQYDCFRILVKHTTVEVCMLSIFGALEVGRTILFKERNLLHASEVTSFTLPYLDDISLDGTLVVALVVWDDYPKLSIQVVHSGPAKISISALFATLFAFLVCLGEVQKVTLRSPWLVVFFNLARVFVNRHEWLVGQVRRSHVHLPVNKHE